MAIADANRKIDQLRRQAVIPPRTEREQLDGPMDPQMQAQQQSATSTQLALEIDGQKVSWLNVIDHDQQIGSGVVRMGGIGDVGTHNDHRFKGYSRRVLESSLSWMRRSGYDTSLLYGIMRFYPKYGFAEAFPGVVHTISTRDAEFAPSGGHRFVDYRPAHLSAVLKMYRANNAGRTGPTRRDPKTWRPWRLGCTFHNKSTCEVALDRRGKPAGYLVRDDAHLTATFLEVGWTTPAVFGDLLRRAAAAAWDCRLENVRFLLPADCAFVHFCRDFTLRTELVFRKDGGGMVRMINIPSALRKLSSELGGRMSSPGAMTLRTNLDSVGLSWSGGRLRVDKPGRGITVTMPQWALAQLLYGYRRAESCAQIRTSTRGLAMLGEMFPPRPHYHYHVDYF